MSVVDHYLSVYIFMHVLQELDVLQGFIEVLVRLRRERGGVS